MTRSVPLSGRALGLFALKSSAVGVSAFDRTRNPPVCLCSGPLGGQVTWILGSSGFSISPAGIF